MKRWSALSALVFVVPVVAAPVAVPDRPGEYGSQAAIDLVQEGQPLPTAVNKTHVCGDFYPGDGPQARPKAGPLVEYSITTEGNTKDIKIVRSTGLASLDTAAIACVATWKYRPARRHGAAFEIPWSNNIGWEMQKPVTEYFNTITTQSRVATPPPISVPASVGRPHVCLGYYPIDALISRQEGTVTLAFTISDQGAVADLRVQTSSGMASLDQAALDCAKDWRYKPAIKNNIPVAVPWRAEVMWKLNGWEPTETPEPAGAPHDCSKNYPPAARAKHQEGTTTVSFRVTTDGHVKQIGISGGSGSKRLDKAAVDCVAAWRFVPGFKNGVPQELPWQATVTWILPVESHDGAREEFKGVPDRP